MNYFTRISFYSVIYKILITIVLLFVIGCVGEKDIKKYAKNNEPEKLISFIENNYSNDSKRELINLAIDEICINDFKDGIIYLNNKFIVEFLGHESEYYYPKSAYIYLSIIRHFNENNILFFRSATDEEISLFAQWVQEGAMQGDTDLAARDSLLKIQKETINPLLDKYLIAVSDEKKDFINQMKVMITRLPHEMSLKYFRKKLKKSLNDDKLDYSLKLAMGLNLLNLNETANSKQLVSTIKNIISLKKDQNILSTEIKNLSLKIDDSEKFLKENKITKLYGYIVQDLGSNYYEINISDYFSSKTGLLYATETIFQSRGYFNLDVLETGDIPMKLKQEHGGFTRNMPSYIEVTSYYRDKIEEQKTSLEESNKMLTSKEKKLQSVKQKIRKDNSAISSFISELNKIVNQNTI